MDAEIRISLKKGHRPTAFYRKQLRETLPRASPGSYFYFQSADIVTQALNFGLTSPIDVQIEGLDLEVSYRYARRLMEKMRDIPGLADLHINQVPDYPSLQVDVDRTRAANLGISARDVAQSARVALSSSSLFAPSFYLNPANNVNYTVAVQVPLSSLTSIDRLRAVSMAPLQPPRCFRAGRRFLPTWALSTPSQTLADLATVHHSVSAENISHYTVQRVVDVEASVEGRDLGSTVKDIKRKIQELGKLPPGHPHQRAGPE